METFWYTSFNWTKTWKTNICCRKSERFQRSSKKNLDLQKIVVLDLVGLAHVQAYLKPCCWTLPCGLEVLSTHFSLCVCVCARLPWFQICPKRRLEITNLISFILCWQWEFVLPFLQCQYDEWWYSGQNSLEQKTPTHQRPLDDWVLGLSLHYKVQPLQPEIFVQMEFAKVGSLESCQGDPWTGGIFFKHHKESRWHLHPMPWLGSRPWILLSIICTANQLDPQVYAHLQDPQTFREV